MPIPVITSENFTGTLAIPMASLDTSLDEFLANELTKTWKELLAVSDYNTIQSLPDPLPAKWRDLLEGADYLRGDEMFTHFGVKYTLLRFLYFNYMRWYWKPSTQGLVKNDVSVARSANFYESSGVTRQHYNHGAIQYHKTLDFVNSFVDRLYPYDSITGSAPTYTVNLSDTTYMANGDSVKIGQDEYTVSNLVEGTSFEVTASSAPTGQLTFTAFKNHEYYTPKCVIL